jgi:GT2 family glycosyltransferase
VIRLSIIIVTYNSGEVVLDCLRTLTEAAQPDWEILLVDNQSSDGMIARIREAYPQVAVTINPENRGFAYANNIGLAQARGMYLALVNPDVLVSPSSFPPLLTYLKAHPQVGIVGPKTFTADGALDHSARPPLTVASVVWQFWGLNRLFPYVMMGRMLRQAETASEPFETAWVQAHCMVIRRAVYEQIGGLDDGLFLFNEEADFCERAARAGWKTVFVPQSTLVHLGSTTTSRYSYLKVLHHHISMLYFFRKYSTRGAVWLLKAAFTLELLLKWAIRRTQALAAPSAHPREKTRIYLDVLRRVVAY